MWFMSNSGFLSIVAHRDRPQHLLVRARRAGEIESTFPKAEVLRTPDADYLFRAVIRREEAAEVIARQLHDIDYDNFKNSVQDSSLHQAYLHTWSIMHRYQSENREDQ